jgi:hypothetical protein
LKQPPAAPKAAEPLKKHLYCSHWSDGRCDLCNWKTCAGDSREHCESFTPDIDGAIAEIDDALNFISLNPHGKLAMLRVRDKLTTESTPFIDDLRETINNTAHREMTRAEEVEYEQAIANAELSGESEDTTPNPCKHGCSRGFDYVYDEDCTEGCVLEGDALRNTNTKVIDAELIDGDFRRQKLRDGKAAEPAGVTLYCPGCLQAIKSNHQCKEERDEE